MPKMSIRDQDQALVQVLKDALWREEQKIERANQETINIKMQLLSLGVELPEGE